MNNLRILIILLSLSAAVSFCSASDQTFIIDDLDLIYLAGNEEGNEAQTDVFDDIDSLLFDDIDFILDFDPDIIDELLQNL